ncbi:MAG: anti-phage ZorAB system protein ZorA [Desulfococcaceae bacterium]
MDWSLLLPSSWNLIASIRSLFQTETAIGTQALSDVFINSILLITIISGIIIFFQTIFSLTKTAKYLRLPRKNEEEAISMIESSPLPLFQEFRRHLVAIPRRDGTDEVELRRSVDAEEVFREKALAPGFTDSRLFLALPGILTGVGVLGTFIGLQIGMGGLDLRDVENLETSIIPLIQGLVVAFSTSVWGVFASLLFNFTEKALAGFARGRIRKLQNFADALIPRYVPEEAMAEMERASRGTEEILKGLSVAIGNEMQKAIGRLGSEIKDAVAQATSEGQGPLAEKSVELLSNALTAELDKIQKQIAKIEPTIGKLSETVIGGQQAVSDAVGKLNAHESVIDKMKEAATEIQGAADAFKETKGTMLESAKRNKEAAEAQTSAAGINRDVAKEFQNVIKKLPEIQDSIKRAALVIDSISGPLNELKTYLEMLPVELEGDRKTRGEMENQTHDYLMKMVGELAQKVGEAAEKFSKIEGLAGSLESAASTLAKASHEIDHAGNKLTDFGKKISEASEGQKNAADSVRAAARSGEKTANALEPLSVQFKEMTAALNAAGTSVHNGAESAKQSLQELLTLQEKWFGGAETGLKALKDRVQAIIDAYGNEIEGQTRSLMKEWTHEVNECLNGYRAHVQELGGYMEELQSSISELQKNTNRKIGK